jgi:DNA-binding PadR family transcriptional regulator
MQQNKNQVLPGILNLMIRKTVETPGPLHGYGIVRRTEQISRDNWWPISEILIRFLEPSGGSL